MATLQCDASNLQASMASSPSYDGRSHLLSRRLVTIRSSASFHHRCMNLYRPNSYSRSSTCFMIRAQSAVSERSIQVMPGLYQDIMAISVIFFYSFSRSWLYFTIYIYTHIRNRQLISLITCNLFCPR